MSFDLRIDEKTEVHKRAERYSANICGYDVLLVKSEDRCELSIYPSYQESRLRMGIMHCMPKSVADIEKFAADASKVFAEIAAQLREAGMDDLRSDWEKRSDDMEAMWKAGRQIKEV